MSCSFCEWNHNVITVERSPLRIHNAHARGTPFRPIGESDAPRQVGTFSAIDSTERAPDDFDGRRFVGVPEGLSLPHKCLQRFSQHPLADQ